MYTTMSATASSNPRLVSELWNAAALPVNATVTDVGSILCAKSVISSTAWPSETPGFRLKERVTDGSWPVWLMLCGIASSFNFATTSSGVSCPLVDLK